MKKLLILIILLGFFVTGCSNAEKESNLVQVEFITTNEVKKIIDNYQEYSDTVIIDVRSEVEYNSGHLKEAINIPLPNIESIDIDKDKKVIVYCRSGSRSKTASVKLKELGYNKVYDMGGVEDWKHELVEE